jgi:hypothetical protein
MFRFGAVIYKTSQINPGPAMIPKAILLMTLKGKRR